MCRLASCPIPLLRHISIRTRSERLDGPLLVCTRRLLLMRPRLQRLMLPATLKVRPLSLLILVPVIFNVSFHTLSRDPNWSVSGMSLPTCSSAKRRSTSLFSVVDAFFVPLCVITGLRVSSCIGYLTAQQIYQSYLSTLASSFGDGVTSVPTQTGKFLNDNIAWVRAQIKANSQDPYWVRVSYTLQLLQGILDGYNGASDASVQLTLMDLWMMNSDGDLEEIATLNFWTRGERNVEWKKRAWKSGVPVTPQPTGTHCSVLVKVTPNFNNLLLAHTTWEDFVEMLRTYKVYDLDFYGTRLSFSSYPAVITSIDDFYITSNKLAVTETTNGIFTPALFQKIVPQSLLSWTRAMQSNVAAKSCGEWMTIFGRYNSGTYNNQWICADYNLFTPGKSLLPGTLWIGEQIPGTWMTKDVTTTLSYGYWPSYNVPFFPEIYNASGFSNQPAIFGDFFSYSLCPRAKIFRRDQNTVVDVPSMQKMIRYNNWEHDPFSEGNPCNQISSRCDLVKGNPANPDVQQSAFGSVDGKVVDYMAMQKGIAYAQAGPTWDQQPAFTWNNPLWQSQPHGGQPDTFKFDWQTMQFP